MRAVPLLHTVLLARSMAGASVLAAVLATMAPAPASGADHQEFTATLQAPFRAERDGGRTIRLHFDAPANPGPHALRWQLALLDKKNRVLRQWQGRRPLPPQAAPLAIAIRWYTGTGARPKLPAGIYQLRLRATLGQGVETEQRWDVALGRPRAAVAGGAPALADRTVTTAHTIHFGNLHSHTNHSDGGGELSKCKGAQPPHSTPYGPADAYAFADQHGLDFLLTSEHNHMFDGDDGTNAGADPAAVTALYHGGRAAAEHWNQGGTALLALYGMEWGVIGHGGHLNILNSPELLGWERNANGQLLADTASAKGDYAGLYTLMRQRGWVGQFNHPQLDQFVIDGKPLAWSADGDAVMLLCEVMNSNAFSARRDEGETRHSNFEQGCNRLLEAGYHLAFSSNQDNHCANWGASYGNRTAVLLPHGTPLSATALLEGLRARRVYATMDKHAELVLTANGRLMGQRFGNRGRLTLQARYRSHAGRRVLAWKVFQGVPGRHGQVTLLSERARTVLTPAPGPHFYYVRATQDDGRMLWSAPVWVDQGAH